MQLAKHNGVNLIRVSGHKGNDGNEIADQLAKLRSERPFIGPEPACGISKRSVRDWTNRPQETLELLKVT
jgi:ribonuclease HI